MNKTSIIGLAITILVVGIIAYLISDIDTPCDKVKCEKRLGLDAGQSDSLISIYDTKNAPEIDTINVFIEASLSMDGYVKNKNSIFNLVVTNIDNNINNNGIAYHFIGGAGESTTILPVTREQINNLHNGSFDRIRHKNANARRNTDTNCMIDSILSRWTQKTDDVSILITDAVFSPNGEGDLPNHASTIQSGIKKTIKQALNDNPNFSVLTYRLKSDFNGTYYLCDNSEKYINQKRPFYVWIFGERAKLTHIKQNLDESWNGYRFSNETDSTFCFMASGAVSGNLLSGYVPYEVLNKKHLFHIVGAEYNRDGICIVKIKANMGSIPYNEDYLTDSTNYHTNKNYYIVNSITPISENNNGYTHELSIHVKGKPREEIPNNTEIEISLLAPYFNTDILNSINDTTNSSNDVPTNTTFMIKPLIQGIYEAYGLTNESNRKKIATFKVFIN